MSISSSATESEVASMHIITGATGFLGRHLVSEILTEHPADSVYCIARSNAREGSAADRVLGVLPENARDLQHRIVVLEGDIMLPDCGVESGALCDNERPKYFWHSAASLNWEQGKRDHIFQTNLEGTRNALSAALKLGCSAFFYVSTAYTCGKTQGDIRESDTIDVINACNLYEASKIEAEQLVAAFCAEHKLPYLILRPGIILGSSETFEPCGSYSGLYGFIRELRKAGRSLGDSSEVVRIYCELDASLAWVPVDRCTADMLTCFSNFRRGELSSGSAVHVVCAFMPESVTMRQILDRILEQLGLTGRIVFVNDPLEERTVLEQVIDRKLEFYSSYIRSHKNFISRLPNRQPVAREMMDQFIDKEVSLTLG